MATPGNPAEDLLDDVAEELEPIGDEAEEEVEGESEEEGEETPEPQQRGKAELPSQKKGKEAKTEPPPPPTPPKRDVPLATFLEEKRKFTEALEAERAERKKLQEQIEKLVNPPKAPPKHAEDPEGFIKHATESSAKSVLEKLEEQGKAIKSITEAHASKNEQDAESKFLADLDRGGQAFAQANPDYGDALHHVRRIAFQQLKLWHPDATDAQIVDAIGKQEIAMAKQAIAAGLDPHQMAYNLALTNGYKKAEQQATKKGKKNTVNGKRVAPPTEDDDDGDDTLDPSETLGRSNGESVEEDEDDDIPDPDKVDPFQDAFNEVFKPRQRRRAVF